MIKKPAKALVLTLVCLMVAAAAGYLLRHQIRVNAELIIARISGGHYAAFPNTDTRSLSPLQQRIIELAKQEYGKRPVSYDRTVLTYTEGAQEAWCADFVSWILREAGIPLNNPNSGSWRIPGVLTLQAYFRSQQHYVEAGDYRPRPGDVAILPASTHQTLSVSSIQPWS